MMKRVLLYKIFGSVALAMICFQAMAQYTSSRRITKSYELSNAGQFVLENKYGNIDLFAWDEDSIRVEINITANGEPEELLDRINPTFDYAEEFLKVVSVIEPKSQSYFSRLFRDINPIDFTRGDVDINYVVRLPRNAQIKVVNKFGDVSTNDCEGRARIMNEHGDVRLSGPVGQLDVAIRFGMLRAHRLTSAEIDVKDGSVDVSSADHIQLTSEGSEIELDSINTMRIKSSKDKLLVSSVHSISGELRFSKLSILKLNEYCDLSLHQADLKIDQLAGDQPTVHIDQTSSDIELQRTEVGMEIFAHLEGGLLRLPKNVDNLEVDVIDEKDEIREVSATLGNKPFASINIKGKKGYILVK